MMDPSELSDAELQVLAHHWRREALRGDRHARGRAHLYEVELRRRMGSVVSVSDSLDSRPLALRSRPRPWWQFWVKQSNSGPNRDPAQ